MMMNCVHNVFYKVEKPLHTILHVNKNTKGCIKSLKGPMLKAKSRRGGHLD